MVSIILCGFFLAAGVWHGISASPVDRIVGGSLATIGEYPYQVSLRHDKYDGHYCGGSIISVKWILTAGYCVDLSDVNIDMMKTEVVVGTNKLTYGGELYWIRELILHENYNPDNMENDIAVLQLTQTIEVSDSIKIISLHKDVPKDGSICQFSGFGFIDPNIEHPSKYLQQVNLTIMPLSYCENLMVSVSSKNLCTKSQGKGVCLGDRGGPLVFDGRQAGLLSFGHSRCQFVEPFVFTNVLEYSSWIRNKTGISSAITITSSKTFIISLQFVCLYIITFGVSMTTSDSSNLFIFIIGGTSASSIGRIADGDLATIGEYPYQVSLRNYVGGRDGHYCSGSIIGLIWILTAAYCVDSLDQDVMKTEVVVGTNKLSWGGESYWINKVILHEYYNPNSMECDIALLQLKDVIKFSETVKIVPFLKSVPSDKSICQLSGFDTNQNCEIVSGYMQQVNLTTMSLSECKSLYPRGNFNVSSKFICTIEHRNKAGCRQDSGSPLVFEGHLLGVLPYYKFNPIRMILVFTSVPEFSSWITNKTGISEAVTTRSSQTFLVLLLLSICGTSAASSVDRIVDGDLATIGDYSYQVSFRHHLYGHYCGGSIIGTIWILTAAYCVDSLNEDALKTEVVVGTNKLSWGGKSYWIKEVIPHEYYNPYLMECDIALLQLKEVIQFSDKVKIIPLLGSTPSDESTCQLSGFGFASQNCESSVKYMQAVNLAIMPLEECKKFYLEIFNVSSKIICTYKDKTISACPGDSGSPLIFNGRQIGVLPYTYFIYTEQIPLIFTSVPEFTSWITDKTGISSAVTTRRSQTFFVSLLLLTFCYTSASSIDRIVDENLATIREYPYQVSLRNYMQQVNLRTMPLSECKNLYPEGSLNVSSKFICTNEHRLNLAVEKILAARWFLKVIYLACCLTTNLIQYE
ncbi:hypothetical protein FQR65_LT03426 [Abscondita terminalis]|nr:hypothetical protein FQR65_LT03426 [Abscondita terminalis]